MLSAKQSPQPPEPTAQVIRLYSKTFNPDIKTTVPPPSGKRGREASGSDGMAQQSRKVPRLALPAPLGLPPPAAAPPKGMREAFTWQGSTCRVYMGDAREQLKCLPEGHYQSVVTSPPYWQLRDYGAADQIGKEESIGQFIKSLVDVCASMRPLLKDTGTMWINMGDIYATPGSLFHPADTASGKKNRMETSGRALPAGIKAQDLVELSGMMAEALTKDGWHYRAKVVWDKFNCWGETAANRPSKDHEYLCLFSKQRTGYYYERACNTLSVKSVMALAKLPQDGVAGDFLRARKDGSVWHIPISRKEQNLGHSAAYPKELVRRCLETTTRPGDHVLDPFFGSGTTGIVALTHGRHCTGIEVNPAFWSAGLARLRSLATPPASKPLNAQRKLDAVVKVLSKESPVAVALDCGVQVETLLQWVADSLRAGLNALRSCARLSSYTASGGTSFLKASRSVTTVS